MLVETESDPSYNKENITTEEDFSNKIILYNTVRTRNKIRYCLSKILI